jgi:hypothetical protein
MDYQAPNHVLEEITKSSMFSEHPTNNQDSQESDEKNNDPQFNSTTNQDEFNSKLEEAIESSQKSDPSESDKITINFDEPSPLPEVELNREEKQADFENSLTFEEPHQPIEIAATIVPTKEQESAEIEAAEVQTSLDSSPSQQRFSEPILSSLDQEENRIAQERIAQGVTQTSDETSKPHSEAQLIVQNTVQEQAQADMQNASQAIEQEAQLVENISPLIIKPETNSTQSFEDSIFEAIQKDQAKEPENQAEQIAQVVPPTTEEVSDETIYLRQKEKFNKWSESKPKTFEEINSEAYGLGKSQATSALQDNGRAIAESYVPELVPTPKEFTLTPPPPPPLSEAAQRLTGTTGQGIGDNFGQVAPAANAFANSQYREHVLIAANSSTVAEMRIIGPGNTCKGISGRGNIGYNREKAFYIYGSINIPDDAFSEECKKRKERQITALNNVCENVENLINLPPLFSTERDNALQSCREVAKTLLKKSKK